MREVRKMVRRGVFLGLCLVAATVPAAIVYWRHTVPLSQCSEVYRRFRDLPGIQASFIHDKQINDTLFLDMTLFVADDSLAFVNLLKGVVKTEEYVNDIFTSIVDENTRFVGRCPKGHLGMVPDTDDNRNEVYVVFPVKRLFAIIHTDDEKELKIVLLSNYLKTFNIKVNEKNY